MNVAVIGGGAIGGVVAAKLKKSGESVVLVCHQAQADAINANGLTIQSAGGRESIRLPALTKLDQPYDLVIFAVKTQDLEDAFQENNEQLESGLILTTQNGVQADNILSSHFDKLRQLSSIVMFGATYSQEGTIVLNFDGDWIIGRPFSPLDPTVHEIAERLGRSFKVAIAPDIMGQKYLKLFVNFNNCIPALVGKSMQETFADMDLCRLSILLLKEGVGIIDAAKIELVSMADFPRERILGLTKMPLNQAAAIIHKTLTGLSQEPLYGSILQSIRRGRTSEIDFINGEVVQIASHLKLPSPLNRQVVDMVHEVERSGAFFTFEQVKDAFGLTEGVKQ